MEDSANAKADGQVEEQVAEEQVEEQTVPKSRMDELNNRMKDAEDRNRQYDAALQQANAQLQYLQQNQQSQSAVEAEQPLDDDQKYWKEVLTPVLDQRLGHLEQNVQNVLDVQKKDTFWSQYTGKVDSGTMQEVEATLNNMRAQGQGQNVSRQDILDYTLGRNRRLELTNRTEQAETVQQQVQEVNKVAVAESGSSTVPPGEKELSDMTADEIMSKYGGEILD